MCIAKIRRLMLPEQPQLINPLRLAKNKEQIKGSLSLKTLTRLEGILLDNRGQVQYSLSFSFDESGICLITSNIGTELLLSCQRCLEPVNIVIRKLSTLGLYKNLEEFSKLENNYEPLQLNEELISLELLVEDEILLAVPLAPRHSNRDCIKVRIAEKISVKNRENPFSVLKKLKNDKV